MGTDHVLEEVVMKKNKGLSLLNYYLLTILMVVMGIILATIFTSFTGRLLSGEGLNFELLIYVLVSGGATLLCFWGRGTQRTEYEYAFTNGLVEVARIINNSRRKNLISFRMRDVEVVASLQSPEMGHYDRIKGIKRIRASLNRGNPTYFVMLNQQDNRTMIIMEPSDAFLKHMKLYNRQAVKIPELAQEP